MPKVTTHEELIAEMMDDPEFHKEYITSKPASDAIATLINIKGGLSVGELANLTGSTSSRLSSVFKGINRIRLSEITELAYVLGYEVELRFKRLEERKS